MGTIQHNQTPSESSAVMGIQQLFTNLDLPFQAIRLVFETAGFQSGKTNMTRDSLLLDELRTVNDPTLLVRTYCWEEPTISIGKHQPLKDIEYLHGQFQVSPHVPIVTRPTGGRAILHGNDIAFAFITNAPCFLNLSLKNSYCVFSHWLKQTLHALGYETAGTCQAGNTDYLRSALCFETRTPSDILAPGGKKLAGCAQARRSGGILQHGSAFLEKPSLEFEQRFAQTLFAIVEKAFTQ